LRRRPVARRFDILPLRLQWNSFAYADKAQEAKRLAANSVSTQADSKEAARARRKDNKSANAAWSNQAVRKDVKQLRKEKKERKRKWLNSQGQTGDAVVKSPAAESDGDDNDEWDELAREERMAKKVRRGDVSQRAFDEEFADL
jgi:ATP-dependent RNA helicase DDX55/SPB4